MQWQNTKGLAVQVNLICTHSFPKYQSLELVLKFTCLRATHIKSLITEGIQSNQVEVDTRLQRVAQISRDWLPSGMVFPSSLAIQSQQQQPKGQQP